MTSNISNIKIGQQPQWPLCLYDVEALFYMSKYESTVLKIKKVQGSENCFASNYFHGKLTTNSIEDNLIVQETVQEYTTNDEITLQHVIVTNEI